MGSDTISAGSLEGDPKFLLGQIAALLRDLPARMDRYERATAEALKEIKQAQEALASEVKRSTESLSERIHSVDDKIDNVEKKQHFVAGAWAAFVAIGTGIAAYLRGHL